MSGPEHFAPTAHRILAHLKPKEPHMATTPEQPNAHGIVGACANHPDRPGAYLWADGTMRCQPCHEEPRVVAWPVARTGSVCGCGQPIRAGDRYAVLDTLPPTSCCEQCTDS